MSDESALTVALRQINERFDQLEQELRAQSANYAERDLINEAQLIELLHGCDRSTVREYRLKYWQSGVHYYPQDKGNLYNGILIADWLRNRHSPADHERAIAAWLESSRPLPRSNSRRGRKNAAI